MSLFNRLKFTVSHSEAPPVSRQSRVPENIWTDAELIEFTIQLRQAMYWTTHLLKDFDFKYGNYASVFRKTNPLINGKLVFDSTNAASLNNGVFEYFAWKVDVYDVKIYEQILKQIIATRPQEIDFSPILNSGRILGFIVCSTTHDGVPIENSKGFVDESDVPPVDTWFYLRKVFYYGNHHSESVLFCWIPKPFEPLMQAAIDVEILDSYFWLDEVDPAFVDRIKAII